MYPLCIRLLCHLRQGLPSVILGLALASCESGGPTTPSSNIALSTTSLAFQPADDQRQVTIQNRGNEAIEWQVMSSATWAKVLPATGSTGPRGSSVFTVQLERIGLPQGSYNGSIQVVSRSEVHRVDLFVEQGAPPQAIVQPTSITIGENEDTTVVEIRNSGGSVLSWSLSTPVPWVDLTPSSGRLAPGAVSQVTVTSIRDGLTRGNYQGVLYLTWNGGSVTTGLSLAVGETVGLDLAPTTLAFGLTETEKPVQMVNNGHAALEWTAAPSAPWITLSVKSGRVPPRSTGQIIVSVTRAGLSHGLHQASIAFASNAGSKSVGVSSNAAPTGTTPTPSQEPAELQVFPISLDFGDVQTEHLLTIHNTGDEPLDWLSVLGAPWVTLSPDHGRVAPHSSVTASVTAVRSGLTPGTYQSSIRIDSNGGTRPVNVSAKVVSGGSAPDPGPPPPPPTPVAAKISVSPTSLNFGETGSELQLTVQNKGSGTLNWTAQSLSGWIVVDVPSGQVPPGGSQSVPVRALRTGLGAAGSYETTIEFTSNGGSVAAAVLLKVAAPTVPPPSRDLDSIDRTGRTDVTDPLNEYLANLPDGSVIHLPAGAKYRAEGVIRILGKKDLVIEGNGALIFADTDGSQVAPPEDLKHLWPRARSHVEILGGSNIVIRDLVVRGAHPSAGSEPGAYYEPLEGQHGFDVRGVDGLLLERVTATDTYGDLLYIGGYNGVWARNVTVRDSHFERSGRQGIAITGAQSVDILNNYVGEVARSVIDLEPATSSQGAIDILFQGNTFGFCRHLLLSSGGGGSKVSDISFIGNRLVGIGLTVRVVAADGARRSNYRILDNTSDVTSGPPLGLLRFARVDGVEIRGNYQQIGSTSSVVWSCESTDVVVGENDFTGTAPIYAEEDVCPDFN